MATRHNTCVNPSLKNNLTGWDDNGAEVPTRVSVTGFPRSFGARYTTNAASSFIRTATGAVTAGQTYTLSIYIKPTTNGGGTIYAEWLNSGGGVISYTSNSYTANGGVVTRISHTGVAPSGAASVRIITDGINFALNNCDFTAVLIEESGTLQDFFDGDSANATWDGTDGNSASTLNDSPALSGTGTLATVVTLTASGATNSPPRIVDTSAVVNELEVTAAALVEDDESLIGLTLTIEWGDGGSDTVTYPTLSASHTYTAAGVYPLLFKATDAAGESDYAADYVIVSAPDSALVTPDVEGIQAAICAAGLRTAYVDTFDDHEPREAPNQGVHAACWLLSVKPVGPRVSGLGSAGTVVTYLVRLYMSANKSTNVPYGEIESQMKRATAALYAQYIGDFTLGGRVRNVDIFGHSSPGLSADAGYAKFDGADFRIMTITLPLIVNDEYEEVP
jgi:hypothetical protein